MVEAWFNHLAPECVRVVSAGANPSGYVHPIAIRVMGEAGIDIQRTESKALTKFLKREFDFVITVCDDAAEKCPVFPGPGERIHWSFRDPATFNGSEEEVVEAFRRTRDLIRLRIKKFLSEDSRFNLENIQTT